MNAPFSSELHYRGAMELSLFKQGAEAKLEKCLFYGKPCLVKKRFNKKYRHEVLDRMLTTQRIKSEVRAMIRCRTYGIHTPTIYMVDMESSCIYMEYFENAVTVREFVNNCRSQQEGSERLLAIAEMIGHIIGIAHKHNIVHGDLTTSNMLLTPHHDNTGSSDQVLHVTNTEVLEMDPSSLDLVLIDFGLSLMEATPEDKGVDLYVLERALLSTHPNTDFVFNAILAAYQDHYPLGVSEVIKKFEEVRLRGRKRTMVG